MGLHQRRGQRQQRHVHEALPLHLRLQRRRSVYQVSSIQVSVSQKINLIWSGCNSNVYCIVCPAFVLIYLAPKLDIPSVASTLTVTDLVFMRRSRLILGTVYGLRCMKKKKIPQSICTFVKMQELHKCNACLMTFSACMSWGHFHS